MLLQGYTVLRRVNESDMPKEDDPRPFKVTRIQVAYDDQPEGSLNPKKARQYVEVIADHPSRNIACYWASQLNEGRSTEEQCRAGIEAYKEPKERG